MAGSASLDDRRHPDESALLKEETLDAEKHYRFVNFTSATRLSRARAKGYREVSREDGVETLFDQADDDGTGLIKHGDRVLMACPKEQYETRRRRKLNLANARLSGPAEQFKSKAKKARVQVLEGEQRHEPGDKED